MQTTKERLEQGAAVLEHIERRRKDTHTPRLGYDTEWSIIARELDEIERNILDDPGALESQLVRVRRHRAGSA